MIMLLYLIILMNVNRMINFSFTLSIKPLKTTSKLILSMRIFGGCNMLRFQICLITLSLGTLLSSVAVAQTIPAQQPASPAWNLPADLAAKRLADDAMKSANGNFQALVQNTSGDASRLSSLTEGFLLASPSGLPQIMNYAAQAPTNEETSAVGLGLCTATSSLMNAANNPASPPAQSQAARDLARSILSSVAAASQANTRTNQAMSTSFGVSVNPNGNVSITCTALNGEVVATTAVSPAAAGSSAGTGSPSSSSSDPGATVGLNGPQARTAGSGRHISGPSAASASQYSADSVTNRTTVVMAVPGPEAGAGTIPLAAIIAYIGFRWRRKASKLTTA